ncbi:MAG: ABC transporter, partial [Planctomycetota bacterium]
MPRHTLSILALAAIVVAFFAINMLASTTLRSARLDLTENKLFTLPAGAKRIAQAVDEPIRFKLYYSRQLLADNPGIVALERRIEDTLYEFIAASRGKIELEVIDPEPSSEVEDEAMAA